MRDTSQEFFYKILSVQNNNIASTMKTIMVKEVVTFSQKETVKKQCCCYDLFRDVICSS